MSVLQYGRKLSLVIGSASGDALDFSAFKCAFQVRRGDYQNPNSCDVRIYNLSDATASRIQTEFTQVIIQAGYEGNFGLIFTGTIKQVRKGRADQRDTYVDVTAADGDEAYNFSTVALSLAAGATPANALEKFIGAMASGAVTKGYAPDLPTTGSVRGRVYCGLVKDEIRDFARNNSCAWSVQEGKLTLIPLTSYIAGDVPVISATTGLIGIPEQTQNGLTLRVLLNPAIKIGQTVKLDNKSAINLYRFGLDVQSQASNALISSSIKTNADGLYYVMVANHSGDTRGIPWYSDLTCLSVDATVPPSSASQAAISPSAASIARY